MYQLPNALPSVGLRSNLELRLDSILKNRPPVPHAGSMAVTDMLQKSDRFSSESDSDWKPRKTQEKGAWPVRPDWSKFRRLGNNQRNLIYITLR
jgi:hypothetical protein